MLEFTQNLRTQDAQMTIDLRNGRRLIGEVFNPFNVANLSGYMNVLDQVSYGEPSARAGQVLGSRGPRAFQVAAKLEF